MMLPFNQTASIERKTGNDSDGSPTFSAATEHLCAFQRKTTFRRGQNSVQLITDGLIFIDASVTVSQGDRITITDGNYIGTVVTVEPQEDFAGVAHHNELFLHSK